MSSNSTVDYCAGFNKGHIIRKIMPFSLHHGLYDEHNKKYSDAVINMNRFLSGVACIKSNDKILDAGCGIGDSTIWLAKNFGVSVIGVDINKNRIKIAAKTAKEEGIHHQVKFLVSDFLNNPLPDNYFDVIWGIESVCYVKDKRLFFAEANRMLKTEGRIIITEGFLKSDPGVHEKREVDKLLFKCGELSFLKADEILKMFEELGFKNLKYKDLTNNIMPSSRREHRIAYFIYPIEKLFNLLGLTQKIFTQAPFYTYFGLKNNIFGYGAFYGEKQ